LGSSCSFSNQLLKFFLKKDRQISADQIESLATLQSKLARKKITNNLISTQEKLLDTFTYIRVHLSYRSQSAIVSWWTNLMCNASFLHRHTQTRKLTIAYLTPFPTMKTVMCTFNVAMKGRKRSLCSPPSYRLSGARFEVDTRIYTCVQTRWRNGILKLIM
jgi:hypothetical protein